MYITAFDDGFDEEDVFKELFFEIILTGFAFLWPFVMIYCRVVKWGDEK